MERIRFTLTIKTVALSHGESINASFLEEMILSLISSAFADTISKWFSPHNDRIVESNSRSVPKTNIQRKRKRPDDKKPGPDTNERKVKKRQRLIWYPPKPPLTSNQLAAKYRADILDDKFSKNWGSIGGKRPQDFGPIRKPPVPLPKRLPLHPIEWFDSNVFSTYQSQKCDRKGYPLRIEKFKAKVLKLEKRVDLCLKSSCWSDIEIPRLMYISMRKIIVGIVRIFYDNGYTDLHKTLSGHSGTISQPVREALSASKLMNVLQHHFVNHPSFRHELSVERALIIREERIKANLKSKFLT